MTLQFDGERPTSLTLSAYLHGERPTSLTLSAYLHGERPPRPNMRGLRLTLSASLRSMGERSITPYPKAL